MEYILSLDQGTSSSRALLFNRAGRVAGTGQVEYPQLYPAPGFVEHDPWAILQSQNRAMRDVLAVTGAKRDRIAGIGLTNQRETTLVWNRRTGQPVCNAISWQDTRGAALCKGLEAEGFEPMVRERTGLLLAPYFSATKLSWILENVEGVRAGAERGELAFGTVDCWLVWHLTGGRRHITDITNAARTLLLNIRTGTWDDDLLKLFGIPASMLPEVVASSGRTGTVIAEGDCAGLEIAGIAGDQQAALFGQGCTRPGDTKNTYGTGCFLLRHTGERFVSSSRRLLTTLACSQAGKLEYALEGSVFIGGAAVQFLRDNLRLIERSEDVRALAASVADSAGVVLVPALVGLGAPYWDPSAAGLLIGLTRDTQAGHIARATIESIALQVAELLEAMNGDAGGRADCLRVDGGGAVDELLLQFQDDILDTKVIRPGGDGEHRLGRGAAGRPRPRPLGRTAGARRAGGRGWRGPDFPAGHGGGGSRAPPPRLATRRRPLARLVGGPPVIRDEMLARLKARRTPWDMVIIGGGATGMGVAVDAASRGYEVVLLEGEDFGKGSSSRSTKMIHGGVRYLEQGNIPLVTEALHERGRLRANAPHLVHDLAFVVPSYAWWEAPFYGIGLKIYDQLAGRYGFGRSHRLNRVETLALLPTIRKDGLKGGVVYHDGQFDDSRLLIHLALTAADHGATLLNYMKVTALARDDGGVIGGITASDGESGQEYSIAARVVINATGIFSDAIRRLDDPSSPAMLAPSQGVHLVLDRSFLPGDAAILVPHTEDGRVLFAIPWHGSVLIGTTDTPVDGPTLEPRPFEAEIAFILETAAHYLARPPQREDIRSIFTGIRPLVGARSDGREKTARLSRGHTIDVSPHGLVTIAGGKWTTYRRMAEDCVDQAMLIGRLEERPCRTKTLRLHGWCEGVDPADPLAVYGASVDAVTALAASRPGLDRRLHPDLPYLAGEVVWAARQEMARTVDDVLARRTRALFLDARAALAMAPAVAALLATELGKDETWQAEQIAAFTAIAKHYLPPVGAGE